MRENGIDRGLKLAAATGLVVCIFTASQPVPAQTSTQTTTANTTADKVDKLIDDATSKILKKLKGVVPDDLQKRVETELKGKLTDSNRQSIIEKVEQKIPTSLKDKLPSDIFNKISGVKMTKIEKLTYGVPAYGKSNQMSLYLPPATGSKTPLIMYIHGGGWSGRPKSVPSWVSTLVKNGYAVAAVNYRLSGEGPFPAQIEDLNLALRYLKQNADKINIDPEKIGLFGLSAGGHLALLMGTAWNNATLDPGSGDKSISRKVACVCDFYGPTDLYALGTKVYPGNNWDRTSAVSPLSMFLGGQAAQKKAQADTASPITYASAGAAPTLIVHGTSDDVIPVAQSQEFAAAMKSRGADITYIELPGARHGFQDTKSIDTARAFFDKYLKGVKS